MKFEIDHNPTMASTIFSINGETVVVPKKKVYKKVPDGIVVSDSISFYKTHKCHVNMAVIDEQLYGMSPNDSPSFVTYVMTRLLREGFKHLDEDCRDSAYNIVKGFAAEWSKEWPKIFPITAEDAESCILLAIDCVFDDPEYAEKKFAVGGYITPKPSIVGGVSNPIPNLSKSCSALNEVVSFPSGCAWRGKDTVSNIIQHLNDREGWSREAIADWLESLDIDLSVNYE